MCCKDFLGNTVEVGDTVAYVRVKYSVLAKGVVESITPKGVWVRREKGNRLLRHYTQIALIEKGH